MKIGIIVYSQTGNTYSVAKRLKEKLISEGKTVEIEKVEAKREKNNNLNVTLTKEPETNKYDTVILCSYVEAFSLCTVMKKYLNNVATLKEKKVMCFVTEGFPYPWMGGNHAIRQMKKIIKEKNATTSVTGVINWRNKSKEEMIEELISKICKELS